MSDVPGIAVASKPDKSFVQGLLENYAAKAVTFDIRLPMGEVLVFRSLGSYAEYAQFKRAAAEYAESRMQGHCHPACKPHLVQDLEALASAFAIQELSVEPKFSELEALQLLGAPFIVEHIMAKIDQNRMAYLAEGRNPLTEAKNESSEIPSSASGSGSRETSTDGTPTS